MNPIALLAFIAGIGTAAPKPEPSPAPSSRIDTTKGHGQKPPKDGAGAIKCHRGGWDGN